METTILGNGVYRYNDYWQLMFNGYDIFMGILTTSIILFIMHRHYKKHYKKTKFANIFWYGLLFRIVCAWACPAVFRFYYDGGDGTMYHSGVIDISHESWSFWWEFILDIFNSEHNWGRYGNINGNAAYYIEGVTNATVVRFGLVLNLISFDSFLALSLWSSLYAFIGLWHLYKVFIYFYPTLYKELGIFVLFYPSAIFWSSILMKEPICIGSLGFLVYAITGIFFWQKNILFHTFIAFVCGLLIYLAKPYIIIAFAPALFFWLFLQFNHRIKSLIIRRMLWLLVVIISFFGAQIVVNQLTSSELTKKFSTEAIAESIKQQGENFKITAGGSNFNLGDFDPSPAGMLKMFPNAVNTALFRPYIWEASNPLMLITALESSFLLGVTLIILFRFKFNLFRVFNIIVSEPFVLFSLVFSIIFGGALGLTTFNYGALARYKIPCLPFLGLALAVLWYKAKDYTSNRKITKRVNDLTLSKM
jgi:hypothetical protein